MSSIVLTIVILLALCIALLAVPLELAFNIERIKQIHGHVQIRWLFGLLRFRIGIPGTGKSVEAKPSRDAATKNAPTTRNARPGSRNLFSILNQSAFRRRLFRFIKDMLRATHSQELFLRLRIGLGDPADTGQLWTLFGPLAAIASNIRSAEVRIEPEFMNPAFEIHSHGKFRLIPIEFIVLTIAFALSPPSMRAWRTLRHNSK